MPKDAHADTYILRIDPDGEAMLFMTCQARDDLARYQNDAARVFAALTDVGRRHDEPFIGSSTLVLRVYSRGYNLNATFIELGRTFSKCIALAKRA